MGTAEAVYLPNRGLVWASAPFAYLVNFILGEYLICIAPTVTWKEKTVNVTFVENSYQCIWKVLTALHILSCYSIIPKSIECNIPQSSTHNIK